MDENPAITWARVDKNFFVASTAGTFLGTIDQEHERGFTARDMRATVIGSFSSLAVAMDAVVESHHGQDAR